MATTAETRTPVHLWIVGVLATIWNAFGCYDYFMSETRNEKYLSMYGSSANDMIAYLNSFPAWAKSCCTRLTVKPSRRSCWLRTRRRTRV